MDQSMLTPFQAKMIKKNVDLQLDDERSGAFKLPEISSTVKNSIHPSKALMDEFRSSRGSMPTSKLGFGK